jgi:hypothetical protein
VLHERVEVRARLGHAHDADHELVIAAGVAGVHIAADGEDGVVEGGTIVGHVVGNAVELGAGGGSASVGEAKRAESPRSSMSWKPLSAPRSASVTCADSRPSCRLWRR